MTYPTDLNPTQVAKTSGNVIRRTDPTKTDATTLLYTNKGFPQVFLFTT